MVAQEACNGGSRSIKRTLQRRDPDPLRASATKCSAPQWAMKVPSPYRLGDGQCGCGRSWAHARNRSSGVRVAATSEGCVVKAGKVSRSGGRRYNRHPSGSALVSATLAHEAVGAMMPPITRWRMQRASGSAQASEMERVRTLIMCPSIHQDPDWCRRGQQTDDLPRHRLGRIGKVALEWRALSAGPGKPRCPEC